MNKKDNFYNSPRKIPIRQTKVAYYWGLGLYLLSSVTFAQFLYEFTEKLWGQSLSDLGLTCIFLALSSRGEQMAVFAYIKDPAEKEKALRLLNKHETTRKPWIRPLVRFGWITMIAGIIYELSIL